ncbi:Avirulence (Avh) protein [Phytophthora cinnamomi]|uniref:Avirulence (Avh) protein n=1 Tax=Phytophthora cinnamomi TaxID=4785 RepID=UPI0035594A4A|nr:Avirulence (Avh) protein [Phytophthora cinnamomi]
MNAFNQKNPDKSATLAAHYGDDGVAAMLKSGDVSNILTLTKSGDKLFENPQFLTWIQFVDDPRKQALDEHAVNLIEAVKKVANTKDITTKLEVQEFQYWANIGKSPDDVFKLYLLNIAGDDLLLSPRLAEWSNYVKVFNQQNSKHQSSLLTVMTKSFGDGGVVQILEAAKKVSSTASTAKRLESEQIQRWLLMSTDDVFKLLKLDKAGEKMFGSPQLNVWGKYMSAFNTENPDKKMS